ncbi:MAG: segregation/condensation protein A [Gammaproteobacteria bacterium]|nr:segregation/condensation protein A [Gammaproteobacteria bacterium]
MNETATPAPEAPKLPKVLGQPLDKLPDDLYIPPDALEVFLEAFEGPLDLLLYLIRRQNLNILDIPILRITQQYIEYVELMVSMKLELAAEYLVMAALLAEIKSRLLLPKPIEEEENVEDPRMTLVRRLQEYERFKSAAENLDGMPRVGREIWLATAKPEKVNVVQELPAPTLRELLHAFRDAVQRAALFTRHQVAREPLSVRERMSRILARISAGERAQLADLVDPAEGRMGVVVCLLAILELVKSALVDLKQEGPFAPVRIGPAREQVAAVEQGES